MIGRFVLAVVVLGACSSKPPPTTTGSNNPPGSGSGTGKPDPSVTSCDAAKSKVADLYRAEGLTRKDAKRIDAYVADNTAMVMAECTAQPARVVPCLATATTVPDLEARCLAPLDDEGTEGDQLKP